MVKGIESKYKRNYKNYIIPILISILFFGVTYIYATTISDTEGTFDGNVTADNLTLNTNGTLKFDGDSYPSFFTLNEENGYGRIVLDNEGISGITTKGYGTSGGVFHNELAEGTKASPTAVADGRLVGGYGAKGYTGTQYPASSPAAIHWIANGEQTDANFGMFMRIVATAPTTTSRSTVAEFHKVSNGGDYAVLTVGGSRTGSLMTKIADPVNNFFDIMQNAYFDGTWKYQSTDETSRFRQFAGEHIFSTAPSGTIATNINWTDRLTISNTGGIIIGNGSSHDNITLTSQNGTEMSCGLTNVGTFVCV